MGELEGIVDLRESDMFKAIVRRVSFRIRRVQVYDAEAPSCGCGADTIPMRIGSELLRVCSRMGIRVHADFGKYLPCPICKGDSILAEVYKRSGLTMLFCLECECSIPSDEGSLKWL